MVAKAKKIRQSARTNEEIRSAHGSPVLHAASVIFTPSSGAFHAPVTTRHSPVTVQITIVSMKVAVMESRPCFTGSVSSEAAAAMGDEPNPASFVKTPLPIPIRSASFRLTPVPAPSTAFGRNALLTISASAAGIRSAKQTNSTAEQSRYSAAMTGTSASQTFVIRLTPPSSTSAAAKAVSAPLITTARE